MPPVVAAVAVAVLEVWGAVVVTMPLWAPAVATAIGYAAVVGGIYAYSANQASKMRNALKSLSEDRGRDLMLRDPVAPRRTLYGQLPVSGTIMYMSSSGVKNEYLHFILKLADHECEELGVITLDGTEVTLDGSGDATGTFAGYVHIEKFLGSPTQAACASLISAIPSEWTTDHKLSGCAYLYCRIKYNSDLFPNGIPVVKCTVKGKKVYDPASGTTFWTRNAAACAADYLMDTRLGKGIPQSRIVLDEWIAAIAICNEDVALDAGGTEKRYTVDGTINSNESPDTVMNAFCTAMAGNIVDKGGRWVIRAGAYRTPTIELSDADLVGPISVQTRSSRKDTYNGVKGTYISPDNQWAAADFPPVKNDVYMECDGNIRLWKDIVLPFTTSSATSQRLAKIDLERGRQQIIVTARYNLRAFNLVPSDNVMLTRPNLGWSSKVFEVIDWAFSTDGGVLAVDVVLRETASGVWAWSAEETTVDLAPNTNLPSLRTVAAPTGLAVTSDPIAQPDGKLTPRLRVNWNGPDNIFVEQDGAYELEYKLNAGTDWLSWNSNGRGDVEEDFILDIKSGLYYDVRIRFRNCAGVRSVWTTLYSTFATGNGTPNAPTGLSVTANSGFIEVKWTPSTSPSVSEYGIYRSTSMYGTYILIASTAAASFLDTGVTPGAAYWYKVNASTTDEVVSAYAGPLSDTAMEPPIESVMPDNPTAAAKPSPAVDGTYLSQDGNVFSYITIAVPGMPTKATWQNLLYRKTGASEWLIAAQLDNLATVNVRLDDLTPNVSYDVATQAWSPSGSSDVVVATSSPFTAPSKTTAPNAPTNLALTSPASVACPPQYTGGQLDFVAKLTWDASTSSDVVRYEIGSSSSTGTEPYSAFYSTDALEYFTHYVTPTAAYYWVRSVDSSGNRSAWALCSTNFNSVCRYVAGNLSEQDDNAVTTTGITTGDGSSTRKIETRHSIQVSISLAGGTLSTQDISLTNCGFNVKPDSASLMVANDSAIPILAIYDINDSGSTSTNARVRVRMADGSDLPTGNYTLLGEFIEYY